MNINLRLYIGDYTFDYDYEIDNKVLMTIFRESDRLVYRYSENYFKKFIEDDKEYYYLKYQNTIKAMKDRLDILGFTIRNCRNSFCFNYPKYIEDLRNKNRNSYHNEKEKSEREIFIAYLCKLTFEDWNNAFKNLYTNYRYSWDKEKLEQSDKLINYILETEIESSLYKYPYADMRELLRIFIEFASDDLTVTIDLKDYIEKTNANVDDNLCDMIIEDLIKDYPINEKIIILTEGSKDTEYIKKSMKLLYPHLYEYYSFMDFHSLNVQGGTDSLVKLLKAFISLGISNRVIAILDNDTAAEVATRNFNIDRMPDNFKILRLPYLYFAKSYPTLGPNGTSYQDINGLACSIELFFGDDVLKEEEEYVPIQWKGYDENLHRYQGEIIKKNLMQNKFEEKLKKCFKNPELINQFDWQPMDLLLYEIFEAFK